MAGYMPTEPKGQMSPRGERPTGKKDHLLNAPLDPAPFGRMANDPPAGNQAEVADES